MALTQVKTTGLADDAVTVAKIPDGTITGTTGDVTFVFNAKSIASKKG